MQQLALHTVGGMIQLGQELMAIVPDDTGIEIEAMAQNQDIGFVHDGEEAVIKLDAFLFTRYDTVPDKIKTLSGDAITSNNSAAQFAPGAQRSDASRCAIVTEPALLLRASDTRPDDDERRRQNLNLAPGVAATVEIKDGEEKANRDPALTVDAHDASGGEGEVA